MHDASSATKSCWYDRCESVDAIGDEPQAIHQPLKDSFLLVMIAVADAHASGMAPDFGRQKQKTQRRGLPREAVSCPIHPRNDADPPASAETRKWRRPIR